MYELSVSAAFDAAHFLRDYEGRCSRMHGHTWTVEVTLAGEELGPSHLLVDFNDVKQLLDRLLDGYDHACLNEIPPFDEVSPTSENLARVFFGILEMEIGGLARNVRLLRVRVAESPNTSATYYPDPV
jgi:6-pyruvoyltetrahydropterin/6-carboxytetrahydropterin synthase